ncbi:TatD family hydrolase [Enterobacteriaceae endosymbiont of Plateumaris rustica]|uniref:TatD family hydrolase n=1 Tax=Enterobacteriaceae endosymbiont of Plateumaris rustica TaxID=2675796 RepID=UPI0014499A95|nr:TatD family hydrolase [Enterobacteriaceae endosymbiont of Plateumaris rustica]QJC29139.1 hydrolase TatD [Enterobacteriaceae endosymbiont of Plateumaris rustica]
MFDISVNLTNIQFDKDRNLVIDRSIKKGIKGMLIIGSNITDSYHAYKIVKKYNNYCWSTVGIHPHYANLWKKDTIDNICYILSKKRVVAIGECGLDFYRNKSSKKEQLFVFNAQLELASSLFKPVFLHCRNAFNIFIKELSPWINKIPQSIIHCFSGSKYELEQCLSMNLSIGISGLFFNKKYRSESINDIKLIPKEFLLTETDSPYLSFKKIKDSNYYNIIKNRNEPLFLYYLLKHISYIRNESFSLLQIQTEKNARNILKI